jgi:hypothetical protein
MSSRGDGIRADGTFTLTGLAPGDYTLVAQASFGARSIFEAGNAERRSMASIAIVANGDTISGLRFVVHGPVRIPVNVIFEDGGPDQPEGISVSANSERGGMGGRATLRDGRLSLEVVPGTYRLSAGAMVPRGASTQPWLVKRLAYRGRELEDDEVELTADPGGRIDVVFTSRSSNLAGGVTDATGKAVVDYTVIIIPAEAEALRRGAFRQIRVARPDPQGRFRAEHLRPGSYLATAIGDAPIEDISDVDFLDTIRRAGTPFRVADGGSATLSLTLATVP